MSAWSSLSIQTYNPVTRLASRSQGPNIERVFSLQVSEQLCIVWPANRRHNMSGTSLLKCCHLLAAILFVTQGVSLAAGAASSSPSSSSSTTPKQSKFVQDDGSPTDRPRIRDLKIRPRNDESDDRDLTPSRDLSNAIPPKPIRTIRVGPTGAPNSDKERELQ